MTTSSTNSASPIPTATSWFLGSWKRIAGSFLGTDAAGVTLRKGTAGAFGVQVCGAGLGLIAHFVVARLLGAEQYGAYALTLTWISLLTVPALLGQDTSVVRFLPAYCHHGAWDKAKGLRRSVSLMVLIVSLVIAVLGALIVYQIRARLGATLEHTLLAGFMLLPVLTQLQLSGALHQALKRAGSSYSFNIILRPILLLGLIFTLTLALHERLSAALVMLASTLAALIALAASAWSLGGVWPATAAKVRAHYDIRSWFVVGSQLLLLSLIVIAGTRLGVLMLGALGGTEKVGPYYAGVQLAGLGLYGLQAVNTILAPMIAERYSANDSAGLEAVSRKAARLGFGLALLMSVALTLTGYRLLGLFGAEFTTAYGPMLVLLLGYCISTSLGEVGFLLSMTDYQKQVTGFVGVGVIINLLLSILLIPHMGMYGAAIATAVGLIVWRGFALVFVIKRMRLNPTIFPSFGQYIR